MNNLEKELLDSNLTLTSVVFEFRNRLLIVKISTYLTLTSVVFEFVPIFYSSYWDIKFNFNKCCI